jgi:outer membrane protein TolC
MWWLSVSAMSLAGVLLAGPLRAQQGPEVPPSQAAPRPDPVETIPPADAQEPEEQTVAPTPGAPTVSLLRALQLALEGNFGLRTAADAVASAHQHETAARSQFYPQVIPSYRRANADDQTIELKASQLVPWTGATFSASGSFGAIPDIDPLLSRSAGLTFSFTQPLLRGFGPTTTNFDLTNSRRALEGQQRTLDQARQQLVVEVTTTFYQVIRQRQLLEVSRRSLERNEALLTASEARMKVGLASKLDVLRAQLEASEAQEGMVSAQAALETALESFRVLLGLSPTAPLEPEAVTLSESPDLEVEPVEVQLLRAKAARSEIQESRDQIHDAERSAAVARQNLLPQLDLGLQVTRLGSGPSFTDSFRRADSRVSFAFTTSYPLQRAVEQVNKALADIEVAARRRALQEREYQVEAEVRAAMRNLERLRKSIELQKQAVDLARQQRRLATLRYQRGLESNFDVVDAERRLVLARSTLVGLLTDFEVGRVQLQRSTGTLDVVLPEPAR